MSQEEHGLKHDCIRGIQLVSWKYQHWNKLRKYFLLFGRNSYCSLISEGSRKMWYDSSNLDLKRTPLQIWFTWEYFFFRFRNFEGCHQRIN
jgi:hypothetical protein